MGLAEDARVRAEAGMAAAQRYFSHYPGPAGPDFQTADRELAAALRDLPDGDPARAEASFMLGAIRISDHELRCTKPCPAASELPGIVALLAAGGIGEDSPPDRMYPFAMTVDKLYDHTHDPADIDRAITWLRRVVSLRRLPDDARRRAQISLAVQYANQGAFDTAIRGFQELLAGLDRRGRRSDTTRDTDRLDARLGLLETYYQRGGERVTDKDLDVMAVQARPLITGMTDDYHQRAYALGRGGTLLLQRIMRLAGDPWTQALNAAVLSQGERPIRAAVARVPGFDADIDLATGALAQAFGLWDHASERYPVLAAALGSAHAVRWLAHGGDEDLHEFGRLYRIVMGHPAATPYYRRQCGEFLLIVLFHHIRDSAVGLTTFLGTAAGLSPSGQADLDTMIGLLARFAAASGVSLDPELSWALAVATRIRAGDELSDAELAGSYARQRAAAAANAAAPAAHAALLAQAAVTGTELVRRGSGPPGLADEVAAAFSEALAGLPADHPIAVELAKQAAAFAASRRDSGTAAPRAAVPGPAVPVSADPLSQGPDGFDVRALAAPGVMVHGRLAVPAGQAAEVAGTLLETSSRPDAGQACVRAVLSLALGARWLRERDDAFLAGSISHLRAAIALVEDGHPLRAGLTGLLAGLLLDRAWAHSDHADADAALSLLGGGTDRDLNALLAEYGPPGLRPLLATGSGYQPAPLAARGSALLLRALLAGGDPAEAAGLLREVVASLPPSSPRRADVLSDLGLALLAGADTGAALEALRTAVAACPDGHPRQPSILLRTAAALAARARDAYDERLIEEGTGLLERALAAAGLDSYGERPRCLYGLGYVLLTRFEHTGQAADLQEAFEALADARAGLEPSPGDPFVVPLLRLLAWAHRQAGSGLHRSQSRSTGRSVLHAQARTVLLQSGSRNAVRAARSVSADALRLAGWCLTDGLPSDAVEALELGRALTLHAATVSAGIAVLLREAGRAELAREWEASIGAETGAVPGDLRRRVLAALRNGPAERRLLAGPATSEIAAALRAVRMDALVYLVPGAGQADGHAVIVHDDGRAEDLPLPRLVSGPGDVLVRFAEAERTTPGFKAQLEHLCDWAWTAAVGPLLDRVRAGRPLGSPPVRLALAPMGILGLVPWPAARHEAAGQVRYACSEAVFTTCASARQLIDAAARPRLRADARSAVLVGNPDDTLRALEPEIDGIWSAVYPGGVRLGGPGQPGGPAEILACLSVDGLHGVRPAVLHLGCHAVARPTPEESRLILAGGNLQVSRILDQARTRDPGAPGGLIVLAACASDLAKADYDEALTLTSAFLAAGATGVIGSRWETGDLHTGLLMFMLHRHLARHPDDSPADALRAAQLWMLDPERAVPAEMPDFLAARARRRSARHPLAWAPFTSHGQ